MSRRTLQIALIYLTGLLQGIALVTYPAAGPLLTSHHYHHLTASEYGGMFLPLIIGAIVASLLGGQWAEYYGKRRIFLWGLSFNMLSMLTFALTDFFLGSHGLVYMLLLVAMFFIGLGFGSTLTTLNTYVVELFPRQTSTALPILHALLGTGTALAPLLFNFFVAKMQWWADPIAIFIAFFILFFSGLILLDLEERVVDTLNPELIPDAPLTGTFWLYAFIIGVYGICETIFGNWASIYLNEEKGLTLEQAGVALSTFWAFVTIGRVMTGLAAVWISPAKIYMTLPFFIMLAFIAIPLAGSSPALNIAFFGMAGLACSAMFPLSIGFAEHDFIKLAAKVSGYLVASYMIGYGIAAYGVGIIHENLELPLSIIYSASAFIAFALLALVLFLMRKHPKFHT